MGQTKREGSQEADWLAFNPIMRLEFGGAHLGSGGKLLVAWELDSALGLFDWQQQHCTAPDAARARYIGWTAFSRNQCSCGGHDISCLKPQPRDRR